MYFIIYSNKRIKKFQLKQLKFLNVKLFEILKYYNQMHTNDIGARNYQWRLPAKWMITNNPKKTGYIISSKVKYCTCSLENSKFQIQKLKKQTEILHQGSIFTHSAMCINNFD